MSGDRVTFVGDATAAVVQGVIEVRTLIGQPPVIVGGLAVLTRLSNPYRATVDLDVVDRLLGDTPQLELLRAADGAEPVEPAAAALPPTHRTLPTRGSRRRSCRRQGPDQLRPSWVRNQSPTSSVRSAEWL